MMEVSWGILSCGLISSDFAFALKSVGVKIGACAARSLDDATKFGKKLGIPNCYGSYEELVKDTSINIIYIGTLHPFHYEHTKLALLKGKHVLVEKPITINKKQLEELYNLAKEKKLYIMEAMWSAFFPLMEKIRSIISSGQIGTVHHGSSDFGVCFPKHIDRIWKPELGGGGLLDIGIYPIYAMMMLVGNGDEPVEITSNGIIEKGIDICGSVILKFSNNRICTASWNALVETPKNTIISGTKGTIIIHTPSYCSEKFTLKLATGEVQEFNFPLPPLYPGGHINFLNSTGLEYEAKEVTEDIKAGRLENNLISHQLSLRVMGVMDEIRKQIGLKYPFE